MSAAVPIVSWASHITYPQMSYDAPIHRYLLTFSPSNPTPGLHTIRVQTAQNYGARIVARANYWLAGP